MKYGFLAPLNTLVYTTIKLMFIIPTTYMVFSQLKYSIIN